MTLWQWLAAVLLCAAGAVSPGPSLAVVLRQGVRGPAAATLAFAWGHASGIGLYATATAAGLSAVLRPGAVLAEAVTVAGALYLGWLGVGAWRAGGSLPPDVAPARGGRLAAAAHGLTVALLNPKVAAFFLALFSQVVTPQTGAAGVALLVATAVVIDGAWYSLVGGLASRPRWQAWYRRRTGLVDRIAGATLLALAGASLIRLTVAS